MTASLINTVARLVSLFWLTGPIFEKELRVSSRRKRNYLLRFAYLALLTVFVTFVWFFTVRSGGSVSRVYQISRMSGAGRYITTTITWFQFLAVQLIAVVMLSTAIGDEIHNRTLGLLMTTPINSFQIVIGKLLSKLLQLALLLAISMPLLAIVRVFGGVPWDYVISSICVTLTAAIFAGSLSLAFSIYNRQAHSVIVRTVLVCFLLYVVPLIAVQLLQSIYQVRLAADAVLLYTNPFIVMVSGTRNMLSASVGAPVLFWRLHCAIMAGASALLLAFSTVCVRRVALRQATGQAGMFSSRKERRAAAGKRRAGPGSTAISRQSKRVKGPPIVWKEMMSLWVKRSRLRDIFTVVFAVLILATAYGYCGYAGYLGSSGAHTAFILVYFFFGLFRTATSAATSITSEKEARTWPILLTTPLTERQIVFSKMIGSCLGGWAFWLLLVAHVVVFSFAGCVPAAAILPLALLVVSSAILVSAVGVFFSSCFKRSSISASVNLIIFLCFTLPVCCPSPFPTFLVSPLFAGVVILGGTGGWAAMTTPFQEAGRGWGWFGAFLISGLALIVLMVIYLSLAFAAFAIAVSNIRRRSY
jgi:ABC-2 type transport system permease protein